MWAHVPFVTVGPSFGKHNPVDGSSGRFKINDKRFNRKEWGMARKTHRLDMSALGQTVSPSDQVNAHESA